MDDPKIKEGLYLFKALIKDGCKWHGDVISKKWSECLYIEDDAIVKDVDFTLGMYSEALYKKEGRTIWIY